VADRGSSRCRDVRVGDEPGATRGERVEIKMFERRNGRVEAVVALDRRPRGCAEPPGMCRPLREVEHCPREGLGVSRRHQHAGPLVIDERRGIAPARRDDGQPGRHGLQDVPGGGTSAAGVNEQVGGSEAIAPRHGLESHVRLDPMTASGPSDHVVEARASGSGPT